MSLPYQHQVLNSYLRQIIGELNESTLTTLHERLRWINVRAGDTLIRQDETGDTMYIIISGRLRAYIRSEDNQQQFVRELRRGDTVGELSLFTDKPRSASVIASRNCVVVELQKLTLLELVRQTPELLILLTRKIVERFQSPKNIENPKPSVLGLIPASDGIDVLKLARDLAAQIKNSPIAIVDRARLAADLGIIDLDDNSSDLGPAHLRINLYLDELEAQHDQLLLVDDRSSERWTELCCNHSDEILLLADAIGSSDRYANEFDFLTQKSTNRSLIKTLVLLYPEGAAFPMESDKWIAIHPVHGYFNIRPALEKDRARLARYITHTSIGLVLAGGGARGLAQLGIYRALVERGIEIDFVGGTSIGAVMGMLIALDRPVDEITRIGRKAFLANPTKDYNFFPLLSLIRGQRLRKILGTAVEDTFHCYPNIEHLWKKYYCVASNYTQCQEHVINSGPAFEAMLASIAIPGAFPPVVRDGDLLCDGGVFNNFPVDVMAAQRGVGKIIGFDVNPPTREKISITEIPGNWTLFIDRLKPRSKRNFKLPSLVSYLSGTSVLYSYSRKQEARNLTDLFFNPPLKGFGLLQWSKFDAIVARGYQHALEVIDALPPEELNKFSTNSRRGSQADAQINPRSRAKSP